MLWIPTFSYPNEPFTFYKCIDTETNIVSVNNWKVFTTFEFDQQFVSKNFEFNIFECYFIKYNFSFYYLQTLSNEGLIK